MKKIKALFFTLLSLAFPFESLHADCFSFDCGKWQTEFRVAYYAPQSDRFQKVYGDSLVDYQFELSKPFYFNWDVWLDVSVATKKGESSYFHDRTRIWIVPISLGLRYQFELCDFWNLYLGAGFNYSYVQLHDDSYYVKRHVSDWNFGGLFKVGLKKEFCGCYLVDLFVDYLAQDFDPDKKHRSSSYGYVEKHRLNVSGFKAGIGLGYQF